MRPAAYLVRFAESGRDGQLGRRGTRIDLVDEIARALPGASITVGAGRVLVEPGDDREAEDAAGFLAGLTGVSSYSPGWRVPLAELEAWVGAWAARSIEPGVGFAVRVIRRGSHRFGSRELAARLGGLIADAVPGSRVELGGPDVVLGVEVRGDDCFVFDRTCPGVDSAGQRPSAPSGGDVRFLADRMLGRLAVWLRLLGHDTASAGDQPDSWIVRRCRAERRVLLTRDRALSRVVSAAAFYVEAREVDDQLAEVIAAFDLRVDAARLWTRCSRCNHAIESVPEGEVIDRLPPRVRGRHPWIQRCAGCDRLYWKGDHCERILARLRGSLADRPARPG